MCVEDYVRTIKFIRGTHAAIVHLRNRVTGRPVRVLYAGCGPRAPLAVPLMALFPPAEAMFTLVDMHSESMASVKSMVAGLGLGRSVAGFVTADATAYRVGADQPPDVILIETMQACLEMEPQVAITRHLLKQAPQAILIPQEVLIELTLLNPSREFTVDGGGQNQVFPQRDRIPVGPVFVLNHETAQSWEDRFSERLPALDVRVPDPLAPQYQPMLTTTIRVYGQHVLQDYDSGLTCPRRPWIKGAIQPGATIHFHYELGRHPALKGEVAPHP